MKALDLFAGPGGWDEGVRALGLEPLGVEWDDDACATRRAAGHPTLQADVAELDPREFGDTELLLASPPCQAFSVAGKKAGHPDRELIVRVMELLEAGVDLRAALGSRAHDARAMLVVEPLRFALAIRPRLVAFEQVPSVLPLWEHTAELLRVRGYSTWTGILNAASYGVPQLRQRAILMASLDGPVSPPAPTTPIPDSYVTMAEVTGWDESDLVGFPRRADTPSNLAGNNVVELDGVLYRGRDLRLASLPAFNLTGKARSWNRYKGGRLLARVTLEEASVLQTFPADYPWQGSRTSAFLQVGNAIPPLMARAIVGALVGASLPEESA